MITIGVRQLVLSPSLQKLSWGMVRPHWHLMNLGDGSFIALGCPCPQMGLWLQAS